MAASSSRVILNRQEDWHDWYEQLRNLVHPEIWPFIDPDQDEELLEKPTMPEAGDINEDAENYLALTQAQRALFDKVFKHYEAKKKGYTDQQIYLQQARTILVNTVGPSLTHTIKSTKSVRECLTDITTSMRPQTSFMNKLIKEDYNKLLKKQFTKTWLDDWEAVMAKAIEYNVSVTQEATWLIDLSEKLQPIDSFWAKTLQRDADNDLTNPQRFREVARQLKNGLKTPQNPRVTRGKAFPMLQDSSTDEATSPNTTAGGPKGKRKRESDSEASKPGKKSRSKCPACGKGHQLNNCWYIFEDLREEDWQPVPRMLKIVEEALQDKELRKKVESIREKRSQSA